MIKRPALLCTASFQANVGFAWNFIEGLYAQMAGHLSESEVPTYVAYPKIESPPAALAGSQAQPVVLDTSLRTLSSILATTRFIRERTVRVMYLTDRDVWHWGYPLLRLAGVRRIILHDHTSGDRSPPTGLRRLLKWLIVRFPGLSADIVIAVSDYVAGRHETVTLLPQRRIRRIWNGVPAATEVADEAMPTAHSLASLSPDRVVIGCACRATPEKGVSTLLEAFDHVWRAERILGNVPPALVFIGSGPQMESLRCERNRYESAADMFFVGYVPNAAHVLRTATLVVVPSVWQDAFPLSVLESLGTGQVVIATRVGGIPEMIDHEVTGLLVPPSDAEMLAAAIYRSLHDPDLRRRLGSAAREKVAAHFQPSDQIVGMVSTFEDVLTN